MKEKFNSNNKDLAIGGAEREFSRVEADKFLDAESQLEKRVGKVLDDIKERSKIPDLEIMAEGANESIGLDKENIEEIDGDNGFSETYSVNVLETQKLNEETVEAIESIIGSGSKEIKVETTLKEQAASESGENLTFQLSKNEQNYLDEFKSKKSEKAARALKERCEDSGAKADYVLNQLREFSISQEAEQKEIPELEGKKFDSETREIILRTAQEQIDALLLSREEGRFQERKRESVRGEVKRYVELIEQAQREGDITQDLKAHDVLRQLQENIAALAYQDLAASENTLGDHGIRHLVDHNINVSERILDEIQKRGQEVRAVDRLMAHQIMIYHDLGYAMDPVRKAINKEGPKGQDAGHNLLSAKFIRERGSNSEDHLNKIFGPEQISQIHGGILNHDSSEVNIKLDNTPEARQANLESAIHIADNTHAFEDKLPEILYSVPESLKTMRLMKAAAEIGDDKQVGALKESLLSHINANEDYSESDKKALSAAARGLSVDSYKFSVGRICGNKPEISVSENGGVEIKVEESAIHQEVVRLFEQDSYDQLKKFIADLTSVSKDQVSEEMLRQGEIGNDKLKIILKIGEKKSDVETDYQKNIESLIDSPDFRKWVQEDNILSKSQKDAEAQEDLKRADEIKKRRKDIIEDYISQDYFNL